MCGPVDFTALIVSIERISLLAITSGSVIVAWKIINISKSVMGECMRKVFQFTTEII